VIGCQQETTWDSAMSLETIGTEVSTLVAATIYQLAMHDDMLPRFTKADMPAKPAEQPGATATPAAAPASNGAAKP
jgi:hypothetical protein